MNYYDFEMTVWLFQAQHRNLKKKKNNISVHVHIHVINYIIIIN